MELNKIIALRKTLHKAPSLSNEESQTVAILEKYIQAYSPTKVLKNIGGHGCCFIFEKDPKLATVALRADLDALPIHEENEITYCSAHAGISHKCGHDGHMSMVCGVLEFLDEIKLNLILLFQPAEETGEGALRMVNDPQFQQLKIDYIFGMHNLPGVSEHKILCKPDVFACSSVGMKIKINGLSAHAAEPMKANTPYPLVQKILEYIHKSNSYELDENFQIITMTHVKIGEESFGITPGEGEIYLTLRAINNKFINTFKKDILDICEHDQCSTSISYHDDFPALENNENAYKILEKAAAKFSFEKMQVPFKWSEDFGHFTQKIQGAYFGLGVGEEHYNLHHPQYDFNDRVIETGIRFYKSLIDTITNQN